VDSALPTGAAAALGRYLAAVDAAAPGLVVGLYVTGSLALGDYNPDGSDIDVVAAVATSPDASERSLLAEIHRVNATRIDGPYVPVNALAQPPAEVGPVAFHVDGRFQVGDCHEVSPITWAILARNAIVLRGPAPVELGVRADDEALRAFSRANLEGYWSGWADTIGALIADTDDNDTIEARMVEWGELGVARVHCAATTGTVVSKTAAGEYALRTFGAEWHGLVQLALDTRARDVEVVRVGELRHACAFVRTVASTA
jgi:hypothetical protein